MINKNTPMDMPSVALTSVVGTIFMYSTPADHKQIRHQVNRNQIHEVHEEDPATDSQRQWRNETTLTVESFFDRFINELDHQLDKVENACRYARMGLFRTNAE